MRVWSKGVRSRSAYRCHGRTLPVEKQIPHSNQAQRSHPTHNLMLQHTALLPQTYATQTNIYHSPKLQFPKLSVNRGGIRSSHRSVKGCGSVGQPKIAAPCEHRDHRRVQGSKPGRTGRLCRVPCDESGWMNVRLLPACSHLVRPPAWTRIIHPVTSGPGPELPYRECSLTVPGRTTRCGQALRLVGLRRDKDAQGESGNRKRKQRNAERARGLPQLEWSRIEQGINR